ncbi:MAG: hypothetical protein UU48_C0013G0019 [Candidatus Uhrbacteria bacterium GW2011_GWF2_41_16]|uniref:Uncharacterized protein n=2 Tax=Candidatus Uhriibacteriota TaxID=1752732 RepID=A0A0G0V984_9BACT|nr:MAG: hypothetical protein UU48_C0013G0019 [Candidatus Uhrbacteria bacterium GW2011_GWF2_41_16]HBP00031.1 hypothetical protein [Candidatus Uhrbacteria bacterium]
MKRKQTALVSLNLDGRTKELLNPISSSLFARFMEEILSKHREQTRSIGFHWMSFPVREFLTAGIWVVMKRLWSDIHTERKGRDAALVVDRMISVWLAIRFGDVLVAVEAFEKSVVRTIIHAVKLGYGPGIDVSMSAWQHLISGEEAPFLIELQSFSDIYLETDHATFQEAFQKPTALFFTGLAKDIRTVREDILREIAKVRRRNRISLNFNLMGGPTDPDKVERMVYLANLLDVENQDIQWNEYISTRFELIFREWTATRLDDVCTLQDLYRKLPVRWQGLPEALQHDQYIYSVETHWIDTQILLVAGRFPDRNYLFQAEYSDAIQALQETNSVTLIRRILRRCHRRGMKISDAEQVIFSFLLKERIEKIRRWSSEFDDYAWSNLIVHV